MGVRSLDRIAAQLVAGGRPRAEPVAVVQRGTFADQRTVAGTLADIAARAAAAGVRAPAITVVGGVAALHDELAWFGAGPLAGRSVAVTRARAQASPLAARLRALGASVVEAPAIRIEPLRRRRCPTSPASTCSASRAPTARAACSSCCRDARDLRGPAIAAIGPGTAEALRAGGIEADVVPERAVAESLVEALAERPVRRALIARAEQARDVLPDALRARGAEVEILRAVPHGRRAARRRRPRRGARRRLRHVHVGVVGALLRRGGRARRTGARIVSIGPITSDALREHGLEPHVEAAEHTPDGLVAALLQDAAG